MQQNTKENNQEIIDSINKEVMFVNNNLAVGMNTLLGAIQQNKSLIDCVKLSAKLFSVQYIEERMNGAVLFTDFKEFWQHALNHITLEGTIAEFGVNTGGSINFIAERVNSATVFGFDSFEGLKEDWSGMVDHPKGKFNNNGNLPQVLPNVVLVKGWFHETIPQWLNALPTDAKLAYLHVDCDTYESTKVILDLLTNRIVSGTVIVFDEYIGLPGWKHNEYRAWQEHVTKHNIRYKYLGCSEQQTSLIVL